jgi:hypothetical protein
MIADEHEFFPVNEEETGQPEPGLEAIDRPSTGKAHIDWDEPAVRAQPRQLLVHRQSGQESLYGESL